MKRLVKLSKPIHSNLRLCVIPEIEDTLAKNMFADYSNKLYKISIYRDRIRLSFFKNHKKIKLTMLLNEDLERYMKHLDYLTHSVRGSILLSELSD